MNAAKSQGRRGNLCNKEAVTRVTKVKDGLIKIKHVTLFCYCFCNIIAVEICHHLNTVQCLQLAHNYDNEARQCADNQRP